MATTEEYSLDTVLLTADGITKSIADWQANDDNAAHETTAATNLDGSVSFEFDDPSGRPGDVVVYTNGR